MIYVWKDPAVDGVCIAREAFPGHFYSYHQGVVEIVEVKDGEPRPVWMTLQERDAVELARALNRELPWGDEAREALADARVVRDRLLTIVERSASG